MDVGGRRAVCYYVSDADFHYLELIQKDGDCPEGKTLIDCHLCDGDCQGTYLSAIVKADTITIIGTIYPKPHVMYNPDFLKKHGLKTIKEAQEYINRCIEEENYRLEPSMGGRRKRIYIEDERAETLFEGCTFRHVQNQPYRKFLNELRIKELEEISSRLPSLKEEAVVIKLKDLKKKLGS